MKNCPRCGETIGDTALACSCGWKDRSKEKRHDEPEPIIPCAHHACQQRAKVNINTPTGRANLCMFHYDEHYRLKALDTCAALGLHTVEQRRAWVKDAVGKLVRKWTPDYQREPGEDWDEPITAAQPQGDSQHGNT